MKLHQSIAVCLALMAGFTAAVSFAQSTATQPESVAAGTATQDPSAAVPAVATAPADAVGKTRAQVIRELEEFQNSDQAAQMRELYRGN